MWNLHFFKIQRIVSKVSFFCWHDTTIAKKQFSNEIFGNVQSGIFVSHEDTNPSILNNRIYDGNANGIEVSKNASATVKNNHVFNNRYDANIKRFRAHEHFEFRFGGIELASGTKVELENNKVFSNKNLIQKCLDSGECLYKLTSFKYYPIQNHYRCLTCNSSGKSYQMRRRNIFAMYTGKTRKELTAICANCVKNCHASHKIQFLRYDR